MYMYIHINVLIIEVEINKNRNRSRNNRNRTPCRPSILLLVGKTLLLTDCVAIGFGNSLMETPGLLFRSAGYIPPLPGERILCLLGGS